MEAPIQILLIEDDMDDVDLLKEALDDNRVAYNITLIMEGDKVMEYLNKCHVLPNIIIMDLNLPKSNGREILSDIKDMRRFADVPILVLTTSSAREDIEYCYQNGAQKFVTKPATLEGWNDAIEAIVKVAAGAE